MPESNEKTVYVLGAGFSAAARIPMQADILEGLLDQISYSFSGIVSNEVEKAFQEKLSGDIEQISLKPACGMVKRLIPSASSP